jgi:hypothetical protein
MDPIRQSADWRIPDNEYICRLESMRNSDFESLKIFMYIRWVDAVGLLCPRLGEHAVHTWDIEVLSDPAARVAASTVELIIDEIFKLPPWFTQAPQRHFHTHVTTTGPDRHFAIDAGKRVAILPGAPEGPLDARVVLPAEAFVRLLFGRLDPANEPLVDWTSDELQLADLTAIFPGGL